MFLKHKRLVIFVSILVFFLVLFTSISRNRFEGDESIYQILAVKLQSLQTYSLQNTPILETLPKEIYDTKIFFYPPTFIIILSLFYFLFGSLGFHILPPILYIIFCIYMYKTVFEITKSEDLALKALVLSVFSPMLLFVSVRTSMDLFMVLMAALSFYFLVLFEKYARKKYIFISGLCILLSILTKYIPGIILLFYIPLLLEILYKKKMLRHVYLFFIPFLLLFVWVEYFIKFNPSLSFFIHSQDSTVLETYRFLDYAYHRPIYFYLVNIFLINPLYFFVFFLFVKKYFYNLTKTYGFLIYFLIEIILFLIISLTIIGVWGGTFQMRYILLAEPFLIILLSLISFEKYKLTKILFFIFLVQNIFLFIFNVVLLNGPENFSLFELLRISNSGGL